MRADEFIETVARHDSAERTVVMLCARPLLHKELRRRIDLLLSEPLDWKQVSKLAFYHRTLPLLYGHCRALAGNRIGPDDAAALEKVFLGVTARSTFLTKEMLRIHDELGRRGVSCIAFKGPSLGMLAYGDPSARQFDDIDFLVTKREMPAAADGMISLGYRYAYALTGAERNAHIRAGWGMKFMAPDEKTVVEMDSGVAPEYFSFRMNMEQLAQRTRELTIDGQLVRTLSNEDLLLLLCVHGAKHAWEKLGWVADICSLVMACGELDWNYLEGAARKSGALRMLLWGLELAGRVAGMTVPDRAAALGGEDPRAGRLADEMAARFARSYDEPPGRGEALRYHLRARERLRDRFRYCVRWALVPGYSDWKALPLPTVLFPLYYVMRPFRLAWKRIMKARAFRDDSDY